jgi:hypothetical protein
MQETVSGQCHHDNSGDAHLPPSTQPKPVSEQGEWRHGLRAPPLDGHHPTHHTDRWPQPTDCIADTPAQGAHHARLLRKQPGHRGNSPRWRAHERAAPAIEGPKVASGARSTADCNTLRSPRHAAVSPAARVNHLQQLSAKPAWRPTDGPGPAPDGREKCRSKL